MFQARLADGRPNPQKPPAQVARAQAAVKHLQMAQIAAACASAGSAVGLANLAPDDAQQVRQMLNALRVNKTVL